MRDRLAPLPLPSQRGRTALITGASSGVGLATAEALAQAGARVILAVRDPGRGAAALARVRAAGPELDHRVELVDTSSLASVRELAARLGDAPLDVLVANAGTGAPRERRLTAEGHEVTLATNYLGHFLLTALLLPNLRAAPAPRVVMLGSLMAHAARLDPDDLELTRGYTPARAYANSKLAMVLFGRELQRRSDAAGWGVRAHAVHPGYAATRMTGSDDTGRDEGLLGLAGRLRVAQSSTDAAQPAVFAAVGSAAVPGDYYGPTGPFELTGRVGRARLPRAAHYPELAASLWRASVALTESPVSP